MQDQCSKYYCLAYPFVNNVDIRDVSNEFLGLHLKKYILQILKVVIVGFRDWRVPIQWELCIGISSHKTSFLMKKKRKFKLLIGA